jgi:putative ABC transport system substrate-binding protein
MVNGRSFLGLCLAAVVVLAGAMPQATRAQQPKRVGLMASTPCPTPADPQIFGPLAAKGWVFGKTVIDDCVLGSTRLDQIPQVAAQLVERRPDVLVAAASPFIRALMNATSTIPIVMFGIPDPVRQGFVANLNQPGGNVTGFSQLGLELFGKRMQTMADWLGRPRKVAILWRAEGDAGYQAVLYQEADRAAKALGFEWKSFLPVVPGDLDAIFARMRDESFDVVYVAPTPLALVNRTLIAELAIKYRLPAISDFEVFADDGLLASYGPDRSKDFEMAAEYIDQILRGSRPADLPVRLPERFLFAINARTAAALGVPIPPSILFRADKVIE